MGKPISIDSRSRLVASVAGDLSRRSTAERFGVSAASAVRWVQALATAVTVEAKPQGGDTRSHRIEAFSSVILAAVAAQKDISLVKLADLLRTEHGASFGASTAWRCLDCHVYDLQKNGARRRTGAARRGSPAPGLVCRQPDLDSQRRVFIDETGASTKMARLRGRALKAERCRAVVPHGHRKTAAFTGALRVDGMTPPMVLNGPMNRIAFRPTSSRCWCPLPPRRHRHHGQSLRPQRVPCCRAIEAAEATLITCRPTHPTSTPIENALSKLKAFLRKTAARTIDDL